MTKLRIQFFHQSIPHGSPTYIVGPVSSFAGCTCGLTEYWI
jgi:hypothetical protein